MVFITDDVFDTDHHPMHPAGFHSGPPFAVQPVGCFQRILVINLHKGIEMIQSLDTFEIIQYNVPAGQGTLVQGFLVIMYG